ncbi:methylated-DNA--protein-cysteine methyltransferase isoform X4 [Acinonyx jubatus]|uniref:Methylated-DNA--protein-cysteine methyltransferase n=1 Tax=Acinonyx jubatus TaxID=32536 RepID=A0A6J1ZPY0_ACIJB|nr:methylated-DNA--protein-cysteine methyltransferase isoform X4 [Acinonyx jubatus]
MPGQPGGSPALGHPVLAAARGRRPGDARTLRSQGLKPPTRLYSSSLFGVSRPFSVYSIVSLIENHGSKTVFSEFSFPVVICYPYYQVRGRMDKTCEMNYKVVDSPLGEIEISACEQGVHEIRLHGRKTPDAGAMEAPPLPELLGCPGEMTAPLKQCVAWLDAYFHEPAALKDLPLPAIHHPVFQRDSFTRQVLWKLLKVVRLGETVSYRQLAALAGRPRAARAVGGAMRTNPLPILIPCHRVVCSSGAVGNYSAGRATKEWLLAHEGRLAEKPSCPGGSRGGGIPPPPACWRNGGLVGVNT